MVALLLYFNSCNGIHWIENLCDNNYMCHIFDATTLRKPLNVIKRDLPICVEIPNIKFDIEKIKLEIEKIKDNWTDIYEANPGITNLHEGSFVQNAYENLKEIPLMTLSEEEMKRANEYTVEDLGSSIRDRIRNKKAKGANLLQNEMLWDVPTDVVVTHTLWTSCTTNFKQKHVVPDFTI